MHKKHHQAKAKRMKRKEATNTIMGYIFSLIRNAITSVLALLGLLGFVPWLTPPPSTPTILENMKLTLNRGDSVAYERLGHSVAASGNFFVLGAPGRNSTSTNEAAVVYHRLGSGNDWVEEAILSYDFFTPSSPRNFFGCSVAIDGEYIVVGATSLEISGLQNSYFGGALVFKRNAFTETVNWQPEALLRPSFLPPVDARYYSGFSTAISGDYIVIGAPWEDELSGSAFVFVRKELGWEQQDKLLPGPVGLTAGHRFGYSVGISGDRIVVGSPYDGENGGLSGSVYIHKFSDGSWIKEDNMYIYNITDVSWTKEDKLLGSASGDQFGFSVAIDGDYIVIGSPEAFNGACRCGKATVFVRTGGTWEEQATLYASDGEASSELGATGFGTSVAIKGDKIVIGATRGSPSYGVSGTAYVFVRSGTVWTEQWKLLPSDVDDTVNDAYGAASDDEFGQSVAIASGAIVVGSPSDDEEDAEKTDQSGAGYAYFF